MMFRNRRKRGEPMTCRHVADVMQRYIDGQLEEMSASAVRAHLRMCRRCGLELDTYRNMLEALRRSQSPDHETVARLRSFAWSLMAEEPAN